MVDFFKTLTDLVPKKSRIGKKGAKRTIQLQQRKISKVKLEVLLILF
jgi:hypothetical protein